MKKYKKPCFVSSNILTKSQLNETANFAPALAAAAAAGLAMAIAARVDFALSKQHLPSELDYKIS